MNIYIKKDVEIHQDVVHKIPRPPNAFMLYANEKRKTMAQMFPTESNKEISKRLGNSWRSLEEDVKKIYFSKAKLIDLEHKKRYPNYVYNPKIARMRKALRVATRDRSIGASPMLTRPNARQNSWIPSHGEQNIVLPSFTNFLERAGCNYSISDGSYIQIDHPSNQGQHSDWSRYQVTTEANSVGENFLIVPDGIERQPHQQKQPASFLLNDPYSCNRPAWFQELPRKKSLDISQLISLKVESDDSTKQIMVSSVEEKSCEEVCEKSNETDDSIPNNDQASAEVPQTQNIIEENDQYLVNTSSGPQRYTKVDSGKVKIESNQTGLTREQIYLPLSEYTFSVPQELLNDDVHCHREYIIKYFMNMPGYEVFDVKGSDEQSFPYVAFNSTFMDRMETNPDFVEQSPNFIPTDVGYIPMFDYNIRNGGTINFQTVKRTRQDQQD